MIYPSWLIWVKCVIIILSRVGAYLFGVLRVYLTWLTFFTGRVMRPVPFLEQLVHLLYLDESGSASDPTQQYFVLAGVSVFEREAHWVEQELNKVALRFDPADPYSIELHGSPMRSGNGYWRRHAKDSRFDAIKEALAFPQTCRHFS